MITATQRPYIIYRIQVTIFKFVTSIYFVRFYIIFWNKTIFVPLIFIGDRFCSLLFQNDFLIGFCLFWGINNIFFSSRCLITALKQISEYKSDFFDPCPLSSPSITDTVTISSTIIANLPQLKISALKWMKIIIIS